MASVHGWQGRRVRFNVDVFPNGYARSTTTTSAATSAPTSAATTTISGYIVMREWWSRLDDVEFVESCNGFLRSAFSLSVIDHDPILSVVVPVVGVYLEDDRRARAKRPVFRTWVCVLRRCRWK